MPVDHLFATIALCYLILGIFVIRCGPWRWRISSEIFARSACAAISKTVSNNQLPPGGFLESEMDVGLDRRTKAFAMAVWLVAILVWPLSLRDWWQIGAKKRRERREYEHAFWKKPGDISTCSENLSIRLRERKGVTAVVRFLAADLEKVLQERLKRDPHLRKGEDGEMLKWLNHRDRSQLTRVIVSSFWPRAEYLLADLMKNALCAVECRTCQKAYPGSEIVCDDDGWSETFRCPSGHQLGEVVTMMS